MRLETLAPCCACVREEDVDVRRVFGDLRDQGLDTRERAAVGGHGDREGAGLTVREGV